MGLPCDNRPERAVVLTATIVWVLLIVVYQSNDNKSVAKSQISWRYIEERDSQGWETMGIKTVESYNH